MRIPEGAATGTVLRLPGLGQPGIGGGPQGDLRLRLRVEPDPGFKRKGNTVETKVSVPVEVAALGGKASVKTLRGEASVTIPPGTSSGAKLRLRGQGIKGGDLHAVVMITVPKALTDEQRALFEQLRDLDDEPPGPIGIGCASPSRSWWSIRKCSSTVAATSRTWYAPSGIGRFESSTPGTRLGSVLQWSPDHGTRLRSNGSPPWPMPPSSAVCHDTR